MSLRNALGALAPRFADDPSFYKLRLPADVFEGQRYFESVIVVTPKAEPATPKDAKSTEKSSVNSFGEDGSEKLDDQGDMEDSDDEEFTTNGALMGKDVVCFLLLDVNPV